MRIEGTFVRSRIARRILALFVLSAFVPALALALLVFGQERALLTEQAHAQLVDASKAYALNVYERLLLVHRDLQQMAADLLESAQVKFPASDPVKRAKRFADLKLMEKNQNTDPFKFIIYSTRAGEQTAQMNPEHVQENRGAITGASLMNQRTSKFAPLPQR